MKKIGFIYTNKSYSVYHSLSVAIELSKYDEYDVHVLCTKSNQPLVLEFLQRFNCTKVTVKILRPLWYFTIPHYLEIKFQLRPTLIHKYASLLKTFDAFVCTMYDDLYLKKVLKNQKHIKYIFSNHGISNRAYSFDKRVMGFDLFFLLDTNDKNIRQALNQLTPTNHAMTGLVKYDLIKDLPVPSFFENDNPTVLYNPHWENKFTSFHKFGKEILEAFAKNSDYNLIFAPHSLLLSRNWALGPLFNKYKQFENILVDPGSELCNNMSYTRSADLYLGDISSQAFEFLYERPKPCLFLDAHNLKSDEKDRPLSWDLGNVVSDIKDFENQLNVAFRDHEKRYKRLQENKIKEMFDVGSQSPTTIGAVAIDTLLKKDNS